MPQPNPSTETISSQLPALEENPKIQYILYYRNSNNPYPQFLFFNHRSADMKVISERAKRHCEVMNYRFVFVKPAVIDLDRAENFLRQGE